jgi:hypothetical protein
MGTTITAAETQDHTGGIRELNDRFRTTGIDGNVVLTAGIAALSDQERSSILAAVAGFTGFTTNNDPYGEHDCASLEVAGHRIIWKIDYYDPAYRYHSDDPANPDITRRVLTIMLAEEY